MIAPATLGSQFQQESNPHAFASDVGRYSTP